MSKYPSLRREEWRSGKVQNDQRPWQVALRSWLDLEVFLDALNIEIWTRANEIEL
jgi:hypothetical protein